MEGKIGVNIGNVITKEAVAGHLESLTNYVCEVFKSGYENHIDQETIQKALELVSIFPPAPTNNSLTNCTINSSSKNYD